MNKYLITKTKITPITFNELKLYIKLRLAYKKKTIIYYANIHTCNLAVKNMDFCKIINDTQIVFPDGTGIWIGLKLLFSSLKIKRFNLTDYGHELLDFIEKENLSVHFWGSEEKIIESTKKKLQIIFPELKINGWNNGYSDCNNIGLINNVNCDILLVGMGTPKQEEWIYKNKHNLNAIIIIAVGDLFSLYAGTKIRGPKIIQNLGLEWFVRLIFNPKRYFKRYVIGIPIFLVNCFRFKRNYKNSLKRSL